MEIVQRDDRRSKCRDYLRKRNLAQAAKEMEASRVWCKRGLKQSPGQA